MAEKKETVRGRGSCRFSEWDSKRTKRLRGDAHSDDGHVHHDSVMHNAVASFEDE